MYLLEYYEVDCMPRDELNQYYIEVLEDLARLNDMASYIEVRLHDLDTGLSVNVV